MTSERDGRPRIYPMSREQEELWLDDLMLDGQSIYQESWASRLTGHLDIGALDWAIGEVVARHEVLRTRLTEKGGEPVQIVAAPVPVRLARVSCAPAAVEAELSRIVAEPLDLDEAPIRPWLICVSPNEFDLVVQLHHAVIDDWSLNIFQRELMHLYTARLLGEPPGLEPLPMQAGEFALAQRAEELNPADVGYWRARVQAAPRSCTIPPDGPGPEELPHRAGRHFFAISPELGQAVRTASRALRTTPFTVFAGAIATLLWRYGEPDEVIFGTPVSLRGSAAVDGMIGYLGNLLPLRLAVSRATSFRMLAKDTKAEIVGAMEHRTVPYSHIVRMTRRRGTDAGVPPLCDVIVVVDDMPWEPFSLPGVTAERIYVPPVRAKCALHVTLVADDGGGYAGFFDYDADVFAAPTVARVADQFATLLAHCVAAPDEPFGKRAMWNSPAGGGRLDNLPYAEPGSCHRVAGEQSGPDRRGDPGNAKEDT